MRNFYCRDKGDFVLEEDKDQGHYRWSTIEPRRVSSGHVNPTTVEEALEQHKLVLELAPFLLSVSPLDCEALDVMFGFDFTYRGNHSQLVAEALGLSPALEKMLEVPGSTVINYEPTVTLALDDECRRQCRVSMETRTNAYQVRTGDYPEEQLSVYVTARQYGSLSPAITFVEALESLAQVCHEMVERYVIDNVLRPLAHGFRRNDRRKQTQGREEFMEATQGAPATRVLIAGAGPVGLTTAAALVRQGLSVRIIAKRPQASDKSKALVVWSRTLELLDKLDLAHRFVECGLRADGVNIYGGGKRLVHVAVTIPNHRSPTR